MDDETYETNPASLRIFQKNKRIEDLEQQLAELSEAVERLRGATSKSQRHTAWMYINGAQAALKEQDDG